MKQLAAIAIAALCWAGAAIAAASPSEKTLTPEQQAQLAKLTELSKSLHPQMGDVAITPASATLHLGQDYYFLPADEAKRVLTEAWGNPPDASSNALGLVFPAGKTFFDDTWAAVVTFNDSGFVSDKQATPAEYEDLLKQVQSQEADDNARRKEAGFPSIHLVGWAQPPAYDKASHTVIWARELQFGDSADHGLNYDLRVLGRHGVLSLNMVSEMARLPEIRTAAERLRATAAFQPGSTFEEFNPSTDKATGYGIAGLVGAGLGLLAVKKLGLLAVILLFAKKGAVVLIAMAAGAVGWVKRKFGIKPATSPAAASLSPPDDPTDQPPPAAA